LVLGVDVARFGEDSSVLYPRRGLDARSLKPIELHGLDTVRVEEVILNFCLQHQPDVIFVDDAGAGGAVVDHLMRHPIVPLPSPAPPRRQNFRLKARTLALANARRRGNSGILSGSASFSASFKI